MEKRISHLPSRADRICKGSSSDKAMSSSREASTTTTIEATFVQIEPSISSNQGTLSSGSQAPYLISNSESDDLPPLDEAMRKTCCDRTSTHSHITQSALCFSFQRRNHHKYLGGSQKKRQIPPFTRSRSTCSSALGVDECWSHVVSGDRFRRHS